MCHEICFVFQFFFILGEERNQNNKIIGDLDLNTLFREDALNGIKQVIHQNTWHSRSDSSIMNLFLNSFEFFYVVKLTNGDGTMETRNSRVIVEEIGSQLIPNRLC